MRTEITEKKGAEAEIERQIDRQIRRQTDGLDGRTDGHTDGRIGRRGRFLKIIFFSKNILFFKK